MDIDLSTTHATIFSISWTVNDDMWEGSPTISSEGNHSQYTFTDSMCNVSKANWKTFQVSLV